MSKTRLALGALLGMLAVGACSGDDGGGSGGGDTFSSAEQSDFCDQSCAHEMTCNGDDLATCKADCLDYAGQLSATAATSYLDCVAASCTTSEDACLLDVAVRPVVQDTVDACSAFETRCTTSTDGLCDVNEPEGGALLRILSEDTLNTITECFAQPCDQVQSCIQAALG